VPLSVRGALAGVKRRPSVIAAIVGIAGPAAGVTVSGAPGSVSTGADGTATVTLTQRGPATLQATGGGTRSAPLTVCVSDGADGFCGSSTPASPAASAPAVAAAGPALPTIAAITEGRRFTPASAPRTLSGTVAVGPAGLKDVLLRLTRQTRATVSGRRSISGSRRCEAYDAVRERWARAKRCGTEGGSFFSIGSAASWSYLLPAALTSGRYVLDIRTVDGQGNVTRGAERSADPAKQRTRVVFTVG
jgi:hypothetical protein